MSIADKYKWLRDRISAEVPDCKLHDCVRDYGGAYDIAVQRNGKRIGFRIEFKEMVGKGEWQELIDDDGERYMGYGPPYAYVTHSLNDKPNKAEIVSRMIETIRSLREDVPEVPHE